MLASFISSSHTCAVDEDKVILPFNSVSTIQIYCARDLDHTMKNIHESTQNDNKLINN